MTRKQTAAGDVMSIRLDSDILDWLHKQAKLLMDKNPGARFTPSTVVRMVLHEAMRGGRKRK